jgi:hypothetical protein
MTWCSPTKCYIQTGMINMISHGYAMNSPVSKELFCFALNCYFISKTIRPFWLNRYIVGMPQVGTECMQVGLYACAQCYYCQPYLRDVIFIWFVPL